MLIFPSSPVWANITREPLWSEEVFWYDSGDRQASSPWERPLYRYNIRAGNFNEIKQAPLHTFVNSLKNRVNPFLFKDPYDYNVGAVTQPTSTNMDNGSGFFFINQYGWRVIPDSSALVIVDGNSGTLVSSVDYVFSMDNGFCTVLGPVSSVWVSSFEFFRKVAFDGNYIEASDLWNNFSANLVIRELIPSK